MIMHPLGSATYLGDEGGVVESGESLKFQENSTRVLLARPPPHPRFAKHVNRPSSFPLTLPPPPTSCLYPVQVSDCRSLPEIAFARVDLRAVSADRYHFVQKSER